MDGLQNLLDALFDYCSEWKLNVNLVKTKILLCKRGQKSSSKFWFWGDQLIDVADSYCYLGVSFYPHGITTESFTYITEKGGLALCKLKYKIKQLG